MSPDVSWTVQHALPLLALPGHPRPRGDGRLELALRLEVTAVVVL